MTLVDAVLVPHVNFTMKMVK